MSLSARLLILAAVPQLIVFSTWWALRLLGIELEIWVSIAGSFGVTMGSIFGTRAQKDITRDVYGAQWQYDATLGRLIREHQETAPFN